MDSFWFYTALVICILVGIKSLIAGLKGENKILWLSINSTNQNHYEKYARIYNLIFGIILSFGCGYLLITKLLH